MSEKPTPEPEPIPVEWIAVVQLEPESYHVLRLATNGVPVEADIGEECAGRDETRDRLYIAADDILDAADSPVPIPREANFKTCSVCKLRWSGMNYCPRCAIKSAEESAWNAALDAAARLRK